MKGSRIRPRLVPRARARSLQIDTWCERRLLRLSTTTLLGVLVMKKNRCLVLIALAALGLHLFVEWMESKGFDGWRLICLQILEGGVLVIDIVAYIVFLCRVTWKMVKGLW